MNRTRTLLLLALCSWLTAPAFAQDAVPAAPPATAAAVPADGIPPVDAADAPIDGAAPAPEAAPLAAPVPEPVPPPPPRPPPPPPLAAPVAPPPPTPTEPEYKEKEAKCLIGKLCIGPVLTLGVIDLLGIGGHARYGKYVGFGFDYQFFPNVQLGDSIRFGWSSFTAEGRLYPFGGAFWIGGGFMYQWLDASISAQVNGTQDSEKVAGKLRMPAFKFGLGFMGHDGLVLGIDINARIPVGGTKFDVTESGPLSETADQVLDLRNKLDKGSKIVLEFARYVPQINLLRLGYLF